ncbi:MAG TPA: hypothetical protein VK097_00490 [Lentibacillus sp.]|nr:hypothetical protein [Lentibacillus sp.]
MNQQSNNEEASCFYFQLSDSLNERNQFLVFDLTTSFVKMLVT